MSSRTTSPYTGKEAFGLFSNTRLEIMILLGLSVIGIIIKLCFNTKTDDTGNSGSATATIWGYGLTIISLFCIMFIKIGLMNKAHMNSNSLISGAETMSNFIKDNLPIGLLIGVLSAIIILYFNFFKRINRGTIPTEFSTFSFLSSLLIIIQLASFYQYIVNTVFKSPESGQKHTVATSALETIMYLLSVLNMIILVIMYILLHFYTTDG